jgi:WD40 repeat protein
MSSSSAAPDLEHLDAAKALEAACYRCGSLQYTKFSLIALFGWMIWGNICFNLFETQGGYTILNLYLQDNFHVSNLTVNILFNMIPMLIGTVMTPIISFRSDRTRSRWGRRIPYILFTAPLLAGFAASIGFSDDIIKYCKVTFPATGHISPFTVALVLIGFLTIGYTFFNEFVGTVYYYLLPDVMPRAFMGRFQGVSGMVGTASGILTNMYVVPYQLTHVRAIHVGLAILYVVGLGMVCLFVKEGQYPPVEDVGEKTKFKDQVRLYFRECFTHPIFILLYLSTAATVLTKGLNPSGIFHLHLAEHRAAVVACANAGAPTAEAPATASAATPARQVPPLLMAMTPDGKRLISGDEDGAIGFWDAVGRNPARGKTVHTQDGATTALAVTPDGRTAICGTLGGTIELWDIASGQCLKRLTAHAGGVRGVAVSRDGTRMASAGTDTTVKIWDLAGGTCLHTLSAHDDEVNCVAFSSDASRVVSGGADKKIIVWDARQGTMLKTLEGSPGPVYAVCFAPAQGSVPPQELPANGWVMRQVYKTGFFLKQVFTNESLYDIPVDQTSKLLAQDGWVLSGGRDGANDSVNSQVRIWDVAEGKEIRAFKGHKGAISCVVYKPDLRVILSGSPDGSVRLWKPWDISGTADDQSYKTFSGYTRGVTSLAATDVGVKMVNASVNGTLHVWNMDEGISLAKGGLKGIFFAIVGLVLSYPIGVLVDRWNPIRTVLWCSLIGLPFPLFFFLWYNNYTFALYMELIRWPFTTLAAMANLPMLIMLYPKTKYGQMSSANALVRQAVAAVAGPLGAILMDYLTTRSLDTDYFRYGYLFSFIATSISFLLLLVVYYQWKKLGGENYVAPEASG